MKIREVAEYYNNLLKIDNFADDPSNNGLQVCGDEERQCRKIAFTVDASLASIEQAVAAGADMLVVHHGLSWGGGIRRWTGDIGRRFQAMFRGNLALYAMHLPLDAHLVQSMLRVLLLGLGPGHQLREFLVDRGNECP